MDTLPIRHDQDAMRFSTTVDGHAGYLDYTQAGDVVTITHTVVAPEIGGRGIAGRLMQAALDFVRSRQLKVVPECSYAADFISRHPESADLLA